MKLLKYLQFQNNDIITSERFWRYQLVESDRIYK